MEKFKEFNFMQQCCYLDNKEKTENEKLLVLYSEMNKALIDGDFKLCDNILTSIDITQIPILLELGLLRILFPARHKLEYWKEFRDKVSISLLLKGRNVEKLLCGLL